MSREKQIEERNELVDLLQDIGHDWDAYIDECQENEEEPQLSYEDFHADGILEAGYRKQEWISVEDRLPEEKPTKWKYQVDANTTAPYCVSNDVLVMAICDNGEHSFMSVGNTANGMWFVYCDDDCEPTVTHWMPLPEPPKMKGGAE